jgi:choline dehydrogenase-like flavoprotein
MKIKNSYEYIIIGSGFGGSLTAYNLAKAGKEVLIVERGKWVARDDSCWDEVRLHLKDHLYRAKTSISVDQKKGKTEEMWMDDTVGGMSTFYGCVSFRMREDDFIGSPLPGSVERDKRHAWPYSYSNLMPFYEEAENLLGIAGVSGQDITEPPRNTNYLHRPPEKLSAPSQRIWTAAQELGYHPFMLPMAINFSGNYGKNKCVLCSTCDHYLCKIEAKNDLSVSVLPKAIGAGAVLLPNSRAVKINASGDRAESVDIINQETGEKTTISCENLIVSGGALSSPHLLLSSGIGTERNSPVGKYLFRHANGVVAGILPKKSNPENTLQKQVGIPDFYFGDPAKKKFPEGAWGMIQDVSSVGKGVIKENAPFGLKNIAGIISDYLINLMCMAEDIPQQENLVRAESRKRDKYGMPELLVCHRYHDRDLKARNALYHEAKRILLTAKAIPVYSMPFETFSHAMGTCRMGTEKKYSAVNPECRVWGFDNMYVIDASVMPSGGSVNPSLTIAALALKASKEMI